MITEEDLVTLGFERFDETAESSGYPNDWYYYTIDIGDIQFITNDNEDAKKDGWKIYLFDYESMEITDSSQARTLIEIIKSNTK
jgi:hypothetical protein